MHDFLSALFGVTPPGQPNNPGVHNIAARAAHFGYDRGNHWLRQVAIALLVWPLFPILSSVAGAESWVTATVSLIVPIGALLAILLHAPVLTVAVTAVGGVPRKAVGAVVAAIAYELLAGVYFSLVPIGDAPELVPPFVLVVTALVVVTLAQGLWGSSLPGLGFSKFVLFVIAFWLTAAFFAGGINKLSEKVDEQNQVTSVAGITETARGVSSTGTVVPTVRSDGTLIHRTSLLGETICSASVDLTLGPAGAENRFEGAPSTQVHWEDGTVGPITQHFGVKGGKICFTGPQGSVVTVLQVPAGVSVTPIPESGTVSATPTPSVGSLDEREVTGNLVATTTLPVVVFQPADSVVTEEPNTAGWSYATYKVVLLGENECSPYIDLGSTPTEIYIENAPMQSTTIYLEDGSSRSVIEANANLYMTGKICLTGEAGRMIAVKRLYS